MKKYEVVDLGAEHVQYFQGFGHSFTDWDDSVYGIGNSFNEALGDALEQLASRYTVNDGWLDSIYDADALPRDADAQTALHCLPDDNGDTDDNDEIYYHVGIRFMTDIPEIIPA